MNKKLIRFIILLAAAGLIFYNFFKLPGRNDIPGDFDEVAFVRNENNQGIILLYYAFTVGDTLTADYYALGKTLPFNKTSGITTAFMFDKNKPYPDKLYLEPPHFDTQKYQPIGKFEIDKVGNRNWTKY